MSSSTVNNNNITIIKTMGRCYVPNVNISEADIYNSISSIYISIPLFIIGFISNIFCMVVCKRIMKKARNRNVSCGIYLITIAVVDTCMITSFFLCDALSHVITNITKYHVYNIFYAYIGYPAFMFFTFLSFWLIAGVDTCRLTMVLFPIKMRQSATRITNRAISLIIIYVFAVNIPNFFSFRASNTKDGTPCRYITHLFQTQSFFNYSYWFQCVFLTVFPWTVIVLVNTIMLVIKFTIPNYTPKWKRRGNEMGHLLFAISIWFVIIIFWQCVAQCFFLKTPRTSNQWKNIDKSFAFAKLGMVLNSSTKIFLFLATSKTFRTSFMHVFKNTKSNYVSRFGTALTNRSNKKVHTKNMNAISPLDLSTNSPTATSTAHTNRINMFLAHNISSIKLDL